MPALGWAGSVLLTAVWGDKVSLCSGVGAGDFDDITVPIVAHGHGGKLTRRGPLGIRQRGVDLKGKEKAGGGGGLSLLDTDTGSQLECP